MEEAESVEIINKRGSFLFLEIERSLSIRNVEINSIDSIIKHFDDPEDCLTKREQCCIYDEETNEITNFEEGSAYDCGLKYGISDTCQYLPVQNGLFRFRISENSLLTSPNQLIIQVD